MEKKQPDPQPGDGLRSVRTTNFFRAVNFELYAKPNKAIMAIGLVALFCSFGYIAYMKKKYENMGYYVAVSKDGEQQFRPRQSNWD